MEPRTYVVRASWDSQAGVWVAESDDVPGLVSEAATPQALTAKLRVLVPELLELNGRARVRRAVTRSRRNLQTPPIDL